MCTCALPLVKCMHLLTDCIHLSSLALSLSLPPPPPMSDLFCPSLHYTCLPSVKQTHHQSALPPLPLSLPPLRASPPPTSTSHPLILPPWRLALPFIYNQFKLSYSLLQLFQTPRLPCHISQKAKRYGDPPE